LDYLRDVSSVQMVGWAELSTRRGTLIYRAVNLPLFYVALSASLLNKELSWRRRARVRLMPGGVSGC
jgi:hypothetical protein